MSVAAAIRGDVETAEIGTWFPVRELVAKYGARHAVELALTRAEAAGHLYRVRRGLYWKTQTTRFGPLGPDTLDAAVATAATAGFPSGVGPTGWSAGNYLGLSTQVPAQAEVVVPGRAPAPPRGVLFRTRSPGARIGLTVPEVALLEVLRHYPTFCEADWPEVVDAVHRLVEDGHIDLDRVLHAAALERHPRTREHASQLAEALADKDSLAHA